MGSQPRARRTHIVVAGPRGRLQGGLLPHLRGATSLQRDRCPLRAGHLGPEEAWVTRVVSTRGSHALCLGRARREAWRVAQDTPVQFVQKTRWRSSGHVLEGESKGGLPDL